jgi:hypothetical protein
MFLSCVVLVAALLGEIPNMNALVAVIFYVSFFAIGLGPIPSIFITNEFDAKYVALVMSASQMVNWVCNFLVDLVFPYMNNFFGAYSFMPLAAVLFFGCLFLHIWLPETTLPMWMRMGQRMIRMWRTKKFFDKKRFTCRYIRFS